MDFLKNVTDGKAFVRTKDGDLVGVPAGEIIEKAKVMDVASLLATKIFVESDGTTKAENEVETADEVSDGIEIKTEDDKEEVVETKKEETEKEETEKEETEKVKPKVQAPKCARKVNKPALD